MSKTSALLFLAALGASALVLGACANTRGAHVATAPAGNQALVYIFRSKYPPYAQPVRISSDGRQVATLGDDDLVAVNLPVGPHVIDADAKSGDDFSFDLLITRPEVVYVLLTGDVENSGVEAGPNTMTVQMQFNLHAYRITQAEAESIASGFGKTLD